MKEINKTLPKNVQKTWDDTLKQNYVEYVKDNTTYKMWLEDEESIKAKISLVKQYNLAGIAAWEKDRESENIWKVIEKELKE